MALKGETWAPGTRRMLRDLKRSNCFHLTHLLFCLPVQTSTVCTLARQTLMWCRLQPSNADAHHHGCGLKLCNWVAGKKCSSSVRPGQHHTLLEHMAGSNTTCKEQAAVITGSCTSLHSCFKAPQKPPPNAQLTPSMRTRARQLVTMPSILHGVHIPSMFSSPQQPQRCGQRHTAPTPLCKQQRSSSGAQGATCSQLMYLVPYITM